MEERQKQNVSQKPIEQKSNIFGIEPFHIDTNNHTVFNAIRDNKGKGLKAKDLINILDTI